MTKTQRERQRRQRQERNRAGRTQNFADATYNHLVRGIKPRPRPAPGELTAVQPAWRPTPASAARGSWVRPASNPKTEFMTQAIYGKTFAMPRLSPFITSV